MSRRTAAALLAAMSVLVLVSMSSGATATPAPPPELQSGQWALRMLDRQALWAVARGEGVSVAVVDSGVDASHPDLAGRVAVGADLGDGSSGDGMHDPALMATASPASHRTRWWSPTRRTALTGRTRRRLRRRSAGRSTTGFTSCSWHRRPLPRPARCGTLSSTPWAAAQW